MLSSDILLKNISEVLLNLILPEIKSEYSKRFMVTVLFLLNTAQDKYKNEMTSKINENKKLKELFYKSLPVIEDNELRKKLQNALENKEKSLSLQHIYEFNHHLRDVFIDLHANIEGLKGDEFEKLERMIWEELSNMIIERSNKTLKLYEEYKKTLRRKISF